VTREHNPVGWKLRDYAQEIGISENFMIFERGMSHRDLWVTYAISDVFLLPSKAEGLGMPLLEAMAVGIPCIATNCAIVRE
jgi:glycosyltransferase involved in cell wall biosynthesis